MFPPLYFALVGVFSSPSCPRLQLSASPLLRPAPVRRRSIATGHPYPIKEREDCGDVSAPLEGKAGFEPTTSCCAAGVLPKAPLAHMPPGSRAVLATYRILGKACCIPVDSVDFRGESRGSYTRHCPRKRTEICFYLQTGSKYHTYLAHYVHRRPPSSVLGAAGIEPALRQ